MDKSTVLDEVLISMFPLDDQFSLCKQKAKSAVKQGNLQEGIKWFILGLNIARKNKNEKREAEFKNWIITAI